MDDISIVLCGAAGSGIQTVERVLSRILKLSGYNVYATKEYMSRIRGGMNSTEIRISNERVTSFVDKIDLLIVLNKGATEHLQDRITTETVVVGEQENISGTVRIHPGKQFEVKLTELAKEIGNKVYSNMVAVGIVVGLFEVKSEVINDYINVYFKGKSDGIINDNLRAISKGMEFSEDLLQNFEAGIDIKKSEQVRNEIFINGTEAVALGAISGGCNFLSFYPMSPSTGVAVFLAQHSKDFGIVVEQVEDEIAAVNMALGAWYAGGRALITTSGGGFALMVEGLSLAGMTETPVVMHLGQRPGPATGLPTRTEQGDLLFSLFAGHGEFPRIIYAPGNLREGFYITQKAFDMADKYQVPVIILTDQYFLDTYYNIPDLDVKPPENQKYITESKVVYKRYSITDRGISSRSIPGYGEGLVKVDSDEHDEEGMITEDHQVRVAMVEKRLKKLSLEKQDELSPELIGAEDFKYLVIGWGSTRNVIAEALEKLEKQKVAFLHLKQVFPLPASIKDYVGRAKETIIIENNATSQLGKLIKMETGLTINHQILKYDGLPFSMEEMIRRLEKLVED